MEAGQLYRTDARYFLFVYPTKETLAHTPLLRTPAEVIRGAAIYWADHQSKELGCKVRWVEPGEVFMMMDASHTTRFFPVAHVLFADFDGWIILADWLQFEPAQL